MKLITDTLELRGLKNSKSQKGNVYYVLNCEDMENGVAQQFYCPNASVFPENLKKGDKVRIELLYNKFKNLVVTNVQKVG